MSERLLWGVPASPGIAAGPAWRPRKRAAETRRVARQDRPAERDRALAALDAAAAELRNLAQELPAEEAEIVLAGVLMAADPALSVGVQEAVLARGAPAADAILAATNAHADAIAGVGDETLAARADDVRSLGRRAARLASPGSGGPSQAPADGAILIADDVGPADVAELDAQVGGIALVGGGATAHAAIVARSLGLPMVTGLEPAVLDLAPGRTLVLDGTAGSVAVDPSPTRLRAAAGAMAARRRAADRDRAEGDLPAVTRDGRRVSVLANVSAAPEVAVALRAGAEGIGLLRTELAFLQSAAWPTESDHLDALEPVLAALGPRPAVVRVLDFGADKSPPFLRSASQRGIALLLRHPDALVRQLRAILLAGRGRDVRILLPLVDRPVQLASVRDLVARTARELGVEELPVGAMVETPAAAGAAAALAARADFLSIGTNDLTAATLGADRFAPAAMRAHHPRVLALIARTVAAAHDAGTTLEVCGEAASDPVMLPLLVGLGVDAVSVGAARVGTVRAWIRRLDGRAAGEVATAALAMADAGEVEEAAAELAGELRSAEAGDAAGEGVHRGGRVLAFGA